MTRKEFDILIYLENVQIQKTQRAIASATGMSIGSVNKILGYLHSSNWISSDLTLTKEGYQALEPYRAKRLIILAAGIGSRLLPITLNTPKPLIRVHGKRIIDSAIDAATAAGIEEIYIVRGYMSEQFDQLLAKYPDIHFIENKDYQETNNISSAMCARSLFSCAYVMEADLIVNKPSLFRKYNYVSTCLGVPVDRSDDWCVLSNNGVVSELCLGGVNCHHLFSIYYWTEDDGKRLQDHIEQLYMSPGGKERFWDIAPLSIFHDKYHVEIVECSFDDVNEIDTLRELQAIDSMYKL